MKKPGLLVIAAILCAFSLSTTLTILGLDKFSYILAGGGKFATFPSLNSQLMIGLTYFVLQLLYLVWFLGSKQSYSFSHFGDVLKNTAIFLGLGFLAYPLGNDVYLYLHSGLMSLSGINPFLTPADAFVSVLLPFVDWGQTSTYGPISQLLFATSARLISIHPLLAIYAYKAICLGLHILNGYLIWRLLETPQREKIAIAYLVHPLLLMEQVGSGHVDVLVSTSFIILFGTLTTQRYGLAFLAMWGGLLSKTIPLLWMPLVGLFLIQQRRWWQLIVGILLSLLILADLSVTALPNLDAWRSLLNPGVAGQYKASLHELTKFGLDALRILQGELTWKEEKAILLKLTQYTAAGFVMIYAWVALKNLFRKTYSVQHLIENLSWVTLILLLFATPWVVPWYASILLTMAAVIPQARLFGLASLVYALSSSMQYLLQGFDGLGSLVAIGLPLLAMLLAADWFLPRSPRSPTPSAIQP